MLTFKQFLAEVMDSQFFAKLLNIAGSKPGQRLYVHCNYNDIEHEGFFEDVVVVKSTGAVVVSYKRWSEGMADYVPTVLTIPERDIELFYIGDYIDMDGKKRKALLCRPQV